MKREKILNSSTGASPATITRHAPHQEEEDMSHHVTRVFDHHNEVHAPPEWHLSRKKTIDRFDKYNKPTVYRRNNNKIMYNYIYTPASIDNYKKPLWQI